MTYRLKGSIGLRALYANLNKWQNTQEIMHEKTKSWNLCVIQVWAKGLIYGESSPNDGQISRYRIQRHALKIKSNSYSPLSNHNICFLCNVWNSNSSICNRKVDDPGHFFWQPWLSAFYFIGRGKLYEEVKLNFAQGHCSEGHLVCLNVHTHLQLNWLPVAPLYNLTRWVCAI